MHLVGAGGQEISNSFQRQLFKIALALDQTKNGKFPQNKKYKDQDTLDNSWEVLHDKWHIFLPFQSCKGFLFFIKVQMYISFKYGKLRFLCREGSV